MINFLLRNIFCGNRNETISSAEIDVIFRQFQPTKFLHLYFKGKFFLGENRT